MAYEFRQRERFHLNIWELSIYKEILEYKTRSTAEPQGILKEKWKHMINEWQNFSIQ